MSDSTGQGISIGDAVISFLGDTQQLDQSIDSLPGKVEAGVSRASGSLNNLQSSLNATGESADEAGEEVQEAMDRSSGSVREARGEVALLGEEFGVRLPRHVQTFVAQLPGVGEALESAFAATAVLFIAEAVVKLTEKVSDFIASSFVYTQGMKDADEATKGLNTTITDQEKRLQAAKRAFDEVGLSASELAKVRIADQLKDQIDQITAALNKQNEPLKAEAGFWEKTKNAMIDVLRLKEIGTAQGEADAAKLNEIRSNQTQADSAMEKARQTAHEQTSTVVLEDELALEAKIDAGWVKAGKTWEDLQRKRAADAKAANTEIAAESARAFDTLSADVERWTHALGAAGMPEFAKHFEQDFSPLTKTLLANADAAQVLGITLKSQLWDAVEKTAKAYDQLKASGKASDGEMQAAKETLDRVTQAYNSVDQAQAKTLTGLVEQGLQLKKNKEDWQVFSSEMGSAVSDAIVAGTSIGAAIEKATEQYLAQLSRKAAAEAIMNLGYGFAALASFNFASASQYFEAAGIFGSIAVGAGAAAGAMGGGASGGAGGSGSMGSQQHQGFQTSGSTSQGTVTSTNVQRFADGALVSKQTLAMIGDAPSGGSAREGVLPLDNPEAMRAIAGAIAEHLGGMSGGGNMHFHTNVRGGVIDSSTLKSVMRQMSKKIKQGTGIMTSSNTHRITRRSQ